MMSLTIMMSLVQGLLYYWPKYVKQSVTIIIYGKVQNWSSRNGEAYLEETLNSPFESYSCNGSGKPAPYRDFIHFTGEDVLNNIMFIVALI